MLRLATQGSSCDFISDLILRALYNEKIGVESPVMTYVIYFISLLTFALNTGIYLHKLCRARTTIAPTGMLNNSQELQDDR